MPTPSSRDETWSRLARRALMCVVDGLCRHDKPRISFGAAVTFAVVAFMAGGFVVAIAGDAPWEGVRAAGAVGATSLVVAVLVQHLAIGPPDDD